MEYLGGINLSIYTHSYVVVESTGVYVCVHVQALQAHVCMHALHYSVHV